ncbi:MAG TPA: glutamate ABC transporter substrate-binding protein [Ilumatobacteraceae bacterium]|nr:glutamate ABC transporter substrate-binding protein [Ilumatobacteraceae bacterium]
MNAHRALAAAATAAVLVAGCSGSVRLSGAIEGEAPPTTTVVAAPPPTCTAEQKALDATRSYEPQGALPSPDNLPAGSTMAAIRARGKLIVGVSGDTLLFGARNTLTNQIEGFDIDMLKEVAKAIFGPDGESNITYKVITYADRLPNLEAGPDHGGVDIVAHTMTINCDRWLRIAFSSEYFDAGQRVLVKLGSGFKSIEDLNADKAIVCAPEGSTNIDLLRKNESGKYGDLVILAKPDVTDCLVAMQQGQADGATGDDTVLAGLKAQDPNTEVVGDKFTSEPYGLGMAKDKIDFVRFVNGVIEAMRTDGRWKAIYSKWLVGVLSDTVIDPPPAVYGRDG